MFPYLFVLLRLLLPPLGQTIHDVPVEPAARLQCGKLLFKTYTGVMIPPRALAEGSLLEGGGGGSHFPSSHQSDGHHIWAAVG